MTNEQSEKAVAIVNYLVQRGHFVDFDRRDGVSIKPMPPKAVVDRVVANEAILTAMLGALDAKPATSHLFVVPADRVPEPDYAMCIACGVPWECHGQPPREKWALASDIDRIVTRECAPLPVTCECGIAP